MARVLVVEPDPSRARLVRQILTDDGHLVERPAASADAVLIAIAEGLPDSEDCAVEDWNMTMRGSHPYMVGAMTCATGRMDYRLYDAADGAFMASGFVYFEGFAFQDYPEISSWPASVDLKYSISPR